MFRFKLILIVHFLSVCVVTAVASGERVGLSHGCARVHIVPLLGDVTSLTTVVPYGTITSGLRILSTEKHWPVRRQHTVYTNTSSQCKGEVHSSPVNK